MRETPEGGLSMDASELPPKPRHPFTIVHLIVIVVVVAVVGIVVVSTIHVPWPPDGRTRQRIKTLEHGTYAYYEDTGRRYFPGQQYTGLLLGDGGKLTGSQYLARSLFTPRKGTYPADFKADPSYASFSKDMIFTAGAYPETLSDGYPDSMAICYYVSRPRTSVSNATNPTASLAQYKEADNAPYTNPPNQSKDSIPFDDFITNPSFSTGATKIPFRDREFLLIAPGRDRKYFTQDDCTNYK